MKIEKIALKFEGFLHANLVNEVEKSIQRNKETKEAKKRKSDNIGSREFQNSLDLKVLMIFFTAKNAKSAKKIFKNLCVLCVLCGK